MPYLGPGVDNGYRSRFIYTATAGQTSFSGGDANGITLTYTDSEYLDVYQNGVLLVPGDDYAATTGTTVVLVQGASLNDKVEMIQYQAFGVADTVSRADGGAFGGNISTSGNLAVTGTSAFTGAITSNAGVVVDNITIDGTEIDLSSGSLTVDSAANITLDCGTGELLFNNGGNGNLLKIQADSSNVNFIGMVQDKDLVFKGNDGGSTITALTLDMSAAGEAKFNDNIVMGTAGKGIHLGVTSATASNLLDDYEEGTFTATLAGASSNPNTACTDTGAYYTKIGRQVTVFINFINVDTTGASGVVTVTGLPFTSLASSGDAYVGGNVAWYNRFGINDGTDTVALSVGQNSTEIAFQVSDKNAVWTEMFHTAGSGAYFRCSTTYLTAS